MAQLREIFGAELDALFLEGAERPVEEIVDEVCRGVQPSAAPAPVGSREQLFADLDALLAEPPPAS